MNFEDAQKIWSEQSAPPTGDVTTDAALLARVRQDAARFEHKSFHSDLVVIFVYCLFGIASIWFAYVDSRPLRIVSASILLPVAMYPVIFRTRNRLPALRPDGSLKDVVAHALVSLHRRRLFLGSFFWIWWGLLCLSRIIAGADAHIHRPSAEQTMHSLKEVALFLFLGLGGFLGNRTHIRDKIDPQIAELEAQQRTFLSSEKDAL